MWRFCDRLKTVLGIALVAHAALAAGSAPEAQQVVENQTTAGRKLIKAVLPVYPREEEGRWTQSCVSVYFSVRKDGKTDQFVVLEATRPSVKNGKNKALDSTAPDERAFDNLSEDEKAQEARAMWRFVEPSMKALYGWQYAAGSPGDEIAVFMFERSSIGGRLMKMSARRLDLETRNPVGCAAIDPDKVRQSVAQARAKKN